MAEVNPFESATTSDVAALFGFTVEAVGKWRDSIGEDAGIWWFESRKGRGKIRWHVPKLIDWRVRKLAETLAARQAPAQAKAMSLIEEEQLRRLKRENDQRDGLVVNRAELDRQWSKVGADLRQRLETVGRRHGTAVANDIARAMADLQRAVHGLLGENK